MAGLQGYTTQASGQVGEAAQTQTPGLTLAAQGMAELSQRLGQFSELMVKKAGDEAIDKAKNDALRDSAAGEPFYKEEVHTIYGKAYNNTLSATYAANADLKINEKSDELSLKHEYDPVGYSKAMDEYVEGMSNTAPTPELKTVIGLSGAKLKNAVFGKLNIAEQGRIKASKLETFGRELDLNINQIIELEASGNTKDSELLKKKNLAHLDAMRREGLIDEATAKKLITDSQFKITYGTAVKNMEELLAKPDLTYAQQYLAGATDENRADMSVDENDAYRKELRTMFAQEVKRRKAAATTSKKAAKVVIKNAVEVRKNNKTPDNLTEIDEAKKLLTPEELNAYNIQERAMNAIGNFGDLTIAGLRAKFDEYKKSDVAGRIDVEVENKIDKLLKEREARADDDVVGLAIKESVIHDLSQSMGVQNNVEGLISGLSEMVKNTDLIQQEYGSQYTNLIPKAAAKEWNDWFNNPQIPVADKIYMIGAVSKNFPEDYENVFSQIGGKQAGMFSFSAQLITSGNTRAAEIALMGANSGTKLEEGLSVDISTDIGNAFAGHTGLKENTILGVENYARGIQSQTDEGGFTFDESGALLEQSIGKIVTWNDQKTILPYGVTKSDFEKKLDKISIPENEVLQEGLRDLSDTFGSGDYQLRYHSPGNYIIRDRAAGKAIYNNDGTPYLLKWGEF